MLKPTTPPLPCSQCLQAPILMAAGDDKATVHCATPGCSEATHKSIARYLPQAIEDWDTRQWGDQLFLIDIPKKNWPDVDTPGRGFGVETPVPCD